MLPQDTRHLIKKKHVTNKEVGAKIQQAIGPLEDLTIVKRHKLKWYGHVSRSSVLAKTILQGTMTGGGGRKKTRQAEQEVTGLDFVKSQRVVGNRKMEETGCEDICDA